ncbi:cyclic nucleotide-binding transcriptional regulator, putative [Heliomicrobium modesticaldum Ice1]|uniref:Cyclic nucleotide-binding transcriptional regulator, putative n=1 Tax=Heliobacterium modesticaldum (strain ATCC 51547 / Ice1) TaxID=498761 RepID=B0TG79_HELMI|nr:DUF2225 domain-containing protein [Heliomicrobium modesticaldum]ABZ84575.1 cyclic nucleotide-binding transcriptional regulator, putative [Heliomicrobium modesticaldum Ice1]
MIAIGQLAQAGHLREFEADDVIFQEGDAGQEMYIILAGQVEIFIHSVDGFPIVVATLGPGDFFGEMSLLEELPRSASVRALERVILLAINHENFESIFSHQPKLVFKIMKGMSSRIRQLNEELRRLKQDRHSHPATLPAPAPSDATTAPAATDSVAGTPIRPSVAAISSGSAGSSIAAGSPAVTVPPSTSSTGSNSSLADVAHSVADPVAPSAGVAHSVADSVAPSAGVAHSVADSVAPSAGVAHSVADSVAPSAGVAPSAAGPVAPSAGVAHSVADPATSSAGAVAPPVGTPLSPAAADSGLFPEGHRQYNVSTTVKDDVYLFDKKTACPICNHNFDIKAIRASKQKLKRVDPDFRQRFEDFEPLWYMIWVCPNCYYANFNFEYSQLTEVVKKRFRTNPIRLSFPRLGFQYSHPRTVDQVFTAYYLTLFFLQSGMPDPSRIAKVWLRISWLYDDVGDKAMSQFAAQKALEFFRQAYYGSNRSASIDQDQRLSILLGELSMRNNEYEEAMKFFRGGIARRGGNPSLNRQAFDRYQDAKRIVIDIKTAQGKTEEPATEEGEP